MEVVWSSRSRELLGTGVDGVVAATAVVCAATASAAVSLVARAERAHGLEVVASVRTLDELEHAVSLHLPAVAVIEAALEDAAETARRVRLVSPETVVLAASSDDEATPLELISLSGPPASSQSKEHSA